MPPSVGSPSHSRAENTPSGASSGGVLGTTGEAVSRPKVMRRPATFSAPNHLEPLPSEPVNLAPRVGHGQAPTPSRAWQDDGRFGVALLTLILLINIALALVIPSPHRDAASVAEKMAATPAGDGTTLMPAATARDRATVTIYAQPTDNKNSPPFADAPQTLPSDAPSPDTHNEVTP